MDMPLQRVPEASPARKVYLAAPYAPRGGGMGRIMAYLVQGGAALAPDYQFLPVETRGSGAAWRSPYFAVRALARLSLARRENAILHVNMAERASVWRKGAWIYTARMAGVPVVLHLHAAELVDFYRSLPRFWQRRMAAIFQSASVVIVLGDSWRCFVHSTLGVPGDRIELLPNGVPDPGALIPKPQGHVTEVLFVGNLLARKGLPDLLVALADRAIASQAWRLTIIGTGDAGTLFKSASALGIAEKIHFVGWQSRAAVTSALRAADIFVLPSHAEALPLVVLEALSLGLPVIATGVGALPTWLIDQTNALVVPPSSPPALSAAIGKLIDDPELAARIGAAGRELYLKSFTFDQFVGGLAAIYQRHCPLARR